MTLTTRLSLFLVAALAAVLAGFSAALYLLADRHLARQADDRLEAAARTLTATAEVEPDGVEWEPAGRPLAFGDGVRWWAADAAGRVVDRSAGVDADGPGDGWPVVRVRLAPDVPPSPGKLAPGKYAVLVLTVAAPPEPARATLRTLAAALAGLTVLVLAAAAVAARAVCRRALAPVARMAAAARAMGSADLADRLPVPPAADELADLGAAFNGLLDRLAEALDRERRFAGEASHQLRTPLAAVIGQVEVALRRDRDPGEYRRVLGTVLDQAGRLRRVVEALLFLTRNGDDAALPGREPVDLAAWVPARLAGWAGHPRAADLRAEPAGPVPATVHPDLFGELLDALVDNALKYSPPGTPVVVLVGRDGSGSWVEVEDRGCGIEGRESADVFRPFFRSAAARRAGVPGAGLGLAVAARIAAAHGGSVGVGGGPGGGSRFRVRLPPG
ncbi:MAG: histidine kinase [Isosphaera sp.]|nr:histidine kinase [Isosphaera sp.]